MTPSKATNSARFALAGLCLLLGACVQPSSQKLDTSGEVVVRRVVAMGTMLAMEVHAESRAVGLQASEAAVRAIEAVEQRLSSWREDSELSRLNRTAVGEPLVLSDEFAGELLEACQWASRTGGAFDPAVGALIDRYALRFGGRWPSDDPAAALAACGLDKLRIENGEATRLVDGLWLDAGAFGKGAALDRAGEAALAAGARGGVFDFGGQLHCFGNCASGAFGVADPRRRDRLALAIEVDGGCLATTANSERRLQVGDRTLGHILDPRSGLPAADIGSVTVWARTAFAADCLSTALFVMGADEALAWAEQQDGIEVAVLQSRPGPGRSGSLVARATRGLRPHIRALMPDTYIQ